MSAFEQCHPVWMSSEGNVLIWFFFCLQCKAHQVWPQNLKYDNPGPFHYLLVLFGKAKNASWSLSSPWIPSPYRWITSRFEEAGAVRMWPKRCGVSNLGSISFSIFFKLFRYFQTVSKQDQQIIFRSFSYPPGGHFLFRDKNNASAQKHHGEGILKWRATEMVSFDMAKQETIICTTLGLASWISIIFKLARYLADSHHRVQPTCAVTFSEMPKITPGQTNQTIIHKPPATRKVSWCHGLWHLLLLLAGIPHVGGECPGAAPWGFRQRAGGHRRGTARDASQLRPWKKTEVMVVHPVWWNIALVEIPSLVVKSQPKWWILQATCCPWWQDPGGSTIGPPSASGNCSKPRA